MRTLAAGDPARLDDEDLLIAGDNLTAMAALPAGSFDLADLDPPFNTGNEQRRGALAYADAFDDYAGFLAPRLERVRELLAPHGTLYLHLDYREAHRCKILLASSSGPNAFSTSSSGSTTMVAGPSAAGRPSTTRSSSTCATATTSTTTRSTASRTWRPAWSDLRRPPAASARATAGGTRSCRPPRARRRAIRPRSRSASCGAWSPRPRALAPRRLVPGSVRGLGTLGAVCAGLGRRYVLVDANPEAIRVSQARLGALLQRSA